jgi:TonB family protein
MRNKMQFGDHNTPIVNRALGCIAWCTFGSAVMGASSDSESQYLVTRQEGDPHFIISIVRSGPCKLPGPPLTANQIRIPWQLYPPESAQRHEEGTVKMKLTLDPESCVSRATILQSSGFWRLDEISLKFVMTLKIAPKATVLENGQPTIIFPIAWGASQRRQ